MKNTFLVFLKKWKRFQLTIIEKNSQISNFFLAFSSNLLYTSTCKVMQSKFMSVKCLPDGELPEDEKRNLAVRGLLLAATEDKYESINYLLL